MSLELWMLAIATVTAVTCALCGTLLLVGRKSMVSEGLSHAVLPGLVIAFAFTRDYNSPWLILSAAASGMVMVWLTQWVQQTGIVDDDAGLGIVFAGMFSVGILIVSAKFQNTHFHADCIIDGNLALAPLDRLKIAGTDWGPRPFYVMLGVLAAVSAFIAIAYKELKLGIFDPVLAKQFGLRPKLLQFLWLGLVSITTVAAFDVCGSILIVALMVAPAAAGYLLTDRLSGLLLISSGVAIVSSIGGYFLSDGLDISPTGPIASFAGLVFLAIFLFAPRRGLVAGWLRRRTERAKTSELLVLEFIAHGGVQNARQLSLPVGVMDRAVRRLRQSGLIREAEGDFEITSEGRSRLDAMFSS